VTRARHRLGLVTFALPHAHNVTRLRLAGGSGTKCALSHIDPVPGYLVRCFLPGLVRLVWAGTRSNVPSTPRDMRKRANETPAAVTWPSV
jgi:hypothetical protein